MKYKNRLFKAAHGRETWQTGLDQSRVDGEGMKIVLYLFKRQCESSLERRKWICQMVQMRKTAVENRFCEF